VFEVFGALAQAVDTDDARFEDRQADEGQAEEIGEAQAQAGEGGIRPGGCGEADAFEGRVNPVGWRDLVPS
jgi:hypothetical protein